MPLGPLAVGSILLGGLQAGVGAWNLNRLNQTPRPNFSITPELQNSYGRAESRAAYGFSPEQRADYFSNVSGRYTQGWRNATDLSGGQLGSAISRGLQGGQMRDLSNFAANDAQQQASNIRYADQVGGQMTNQRNMIANQDIQDRIRKEQAFGGAVSSGLNNIAGAANFFAMNGGFDKKVDPNGQTSPAQQSFGINPNSPLYNNGATSTVPQNNLNPPLYGGYGVPAYQTPQYNPAQNFSGVTPQYGYGGPYGTVPTMNPNINNGPYFGPVNPFRPK